MPSKPKVYMDSCCFIELALHSIGKHDPQRDNDLWFLKQLLNAAFDGAVEVLTSVLSIAECSHAKGDVSDDVKSLFRRFLTSGQYVLLVQDSILVAEKARNLRWVHGLHLGGVDSIHIASALELNCEEFLTWDSQPHAYAAALNDLALYVRFPHDTHCLPDAYRQLPIETQQSPAANTDQNGADKHETDSAPAGIRADDDGDHGDEARTGRSSETTGEAEGDEIAIRKEEEARIEEQPKVGSASAADSGNNAALSPTPDSVVVESEQSALGGGEQKP